MPVIENDEYLLEIAEGHSVFFQDKRTGESRYIEYSALKNPGLVKATATMLHSILDCIHSQTMLLYPDDFPESIKLKSDVKPIDASDLLPVIDFVQKQVVRV
jgi:hypothetical protein